MNSNLTCIHLFLTIKIVFPVKKPIRNTSHSTSQSLSRSEKRRRSVVKEFLAQLPKVLREILRHPCARVRELCILMRDPKILSLSIIFLISKNYYRTFFYRIISGKESKKIRKNIDIMVNNSNEQKGIFIN